MSENKEKLYQEITEEFNKYKEDQGRFFNSGNKTVAEIKENTAKLTGAIKKYKENINIKWDKLKNDDTKTAKGKQEELNKAKDTVKLALLKDISELETNIKQRIKETEKELDNYYNTGEGADQKTLKLNEVNTQLQYIDNVKELKGLLQEETDPYKRQQIAKLSKLKFKQEKPETIKSIVFETLPEKEYNIRANIAESKNLLQGLNNARKFMLDDLKAVTERKTAGLYMNYEDNLKVTNKAVYKHILEQL